MTETSTPNPPVLMYMRIAFILPVLLMLTGVAFGAVIWVTQGADATMYFPGRSREHDIAVPLGTLFYGVMAALGIFGSRYVPRTVKLRSAAAQEQRNEA